MRRPTSPSARPLPLLESVRCPGLSRGCGTDSSTLGRLEDPSRRFLVGSTYSLLDHGRCPFRRLTENHCVDLTDLQRALSCPSRTRPNYSAYSQSLSRTSRGPLLSVLSRDRMTDRWSSLFAQSPPARPRLRPDFFRQATLTTPPTAGRHFTRSFSLFVSLLFDLLLVSRLLFAPKHPSVVQRLNPQRNKHANPQRGLASAPDRTGRSVPRTSDLEGL